MIPQMFTVKPGPCSTSFNLQAAIMDALLCFSEVRALMQEDTVRTAKFDQCQFGLVAPGSKRPMKKRTHIVTNSMNVYKAFHGKFCQNEHTHQVIEGASAGVRLSTAAQHYPEAMVKALSLAFIAEEDGFET